MVLLKMMMVKSKICKAKNKCFRRNIEETDDKIIIWANYIYNIKQINKFLKNKYGEDSVVSIYGEVNVEDRKKAIELIQNR